MINKFTATCFRCNKPVQAGAGQTNKVNGQWKTEHNSCPVFNTRPYYNDPFYDPTDPYDNPYHDMTESEWDPDIGDR